MKRTRLVSIDSETAPAAEQSQSEEAAEAVISEEDIEPSDTDEYDWSEEEELSVKVAWLTPALALIAMGGWTAFFAWAHRSELSGVTPLQAIEWAGDWAPPVIVIALAWLLVMRLSRREARRFGDAAQSLRLESQLLEARLQSVNGELTVAREFLGSQSRDLDSLGRMAAERIGEHSQRLRTLIHENGEQVDRIADVSSKALENMESLRADLPVVAASTKDVTNNIAQAGRAAQGQLEEMVEGLKRVNKFGEASEWQIETLRTRVNEAFEEFTKVTTESGEKLAERYNSLSSTVADARLRFEQEEVQALAAMRERWSAVGDQIRDAITELSTLDEQVLVPASDRVGLMREEHRAMIGDAENAREVHDSAVAARREALESESRDAIEALRERMDALDAELEERAAAHAERAKEMVEAGTRLTERMEALADSASRAQQLGGEADLALNDALVGTGERLAATDEALRETHSTIETLTDTTVRLLELVRATAEIGAGDLPQALSSGVDTLNSLEERATRVREELMSATDRSRTLTGDMETAQGKLAVLIEDFAGFETGSETQRERLAELAAELDTVREKSEALAQQARDQLATSIESLKAANTAALEQIETDGGQGLSAWAERLGEASSAAIERAMNARIAETAGTMEEATSRAADQGREATLQLRDQLAKIDELTANLERRIAQARERAEEQVDNDFSRRAALITESLNSSSIDIAKAMSADVADTAWASYLKGDRGIFTRRAVRLLDNGEAREVAELYEGDDGFREDVSRYIHDFEGMLRQLLSTRDGHALGVTLLSSDMGKLYVALAQGIERLRS